jgi:hypothetical protein
VLQAVRKWPLGKARKNRSARRHWKYVERCGLQRNATDGRFSTAGQRARRRQDTGKAPVNGSMAGVIVR